MILTTRSSTLTTTTMQTRPTTTSISQQTSTTSLTSKCNLNNPSTQYCYTLPELYGTYYGNIDHNDQNFKAGSTVTFSKVCSEDWFYPTYLGPWYQNHDGSPKYNCDNINNHGFDICDNNVLFYLSRSVKTADGYITPLNCPVCGCTPGQNDAITMLERQVGEDWYQNG